MPRLDLTFFGAFQATLDDEPITHFRSANIQGLLVYLALHADRAFPREVLITLFWPDEPEKKARANFRQSLYLLRKLLKDEQKKGDTKARADDEPPRFLISRQTVQFNPDSNYSLDVDCFRSTIDQSNWADALSHAQGELLSGFACESAAFEEWLLLEREHWQQRVLEVMTNLTEEQIERGNFSEAQTTARRLLEMEPWRESAHRYLMLALALDGDRSEALAQYERCSHALMDELGVTPSPELDTLYDQILDGEISAESAGQLLLIGAEVPTPFQAIAPPPHFVGREELIATINDELRARMKKGAGPQVVALVGMGGVGKTTLAAGIANAAREHFADGVLWANTATSSPQDILELWGRAYNHDFSGLSDLESKATAVRSLLADKETLLVLDNAEGAARLRPLLPNGPKTAVLITTRNRELAVALNAHVHPVGELSVESGVALLRQILGEDRVRQEPEKAIEICQRLDALPLAVEIAAQRLKSRTRMSLQQMAERLGDTGRRLGLKISDQAVRTSFEVSWEGLGEELQAFFPLLAVFEGRPFSVEALAYVAEMDALDVEDLLYELNALSLVREDETAYFRQHPLLADFAKEKLATGATYQQHGIVAEITGEKLAKTDHAYRRLVDYYLAFVEENVKQYERLEPEWANILAAIETAHRLKAWGSVLSITNRLAETWQTRARYSDARDGFSLALEAAVQLDDSAAEAITLQHWGKACLEQNDYDEAEAYFEKSRDYYLDIDDKIGVADTQDYLARIALEQSQYDKAALLLEENLAIRRAEGDQLGIASIYYHKANIQYDGANWAEARELATKALSIQQEQKDLSSQIGTARLLAQIYLVQKEYDEASAYIRHAQTVSEQIQDASESAINLYTLTAILSKQRQFGQARVVAERSLSLLRRIGDRSTEGLLLSLMGEIATSEGQFEKAKEFYDQSVAIAREFSDKIALAYALMRLESIYERQGQKKESLATLAEVSIIAQELNHPYLIQYIEQREAMN